MADGRDPGAGLVVFRGAVGGMERFGGTRRLLCRKSLRVIFVRDHRPAWASHH